jgi:hypothetical protein
MDLKWIFYLALERCLECRKLISSESVQPIEAFAANVGVEPLASDQQPILTTTS